MKKIQCELCGSPDIVMIESGFFQCQHCGCKYTKEQLQVVLSGVVETTVGNAELERLVENAQAQMQMKNYDEALTVINELTKQFPKDYRGYWLRIRCMFENCFNCGYVYGLSFSYFISAYDKLCRVVDQFGGMEKPTIDKYVNENSQRIFDMLVTGELYCSFDYGIDSDNLPVLQKAYDLGRENAERLDSFGLRYANFTIATDDGYRGKSYILPYGDSITFFLGKTIAYYDDDEHWWKIESDFSMPLDKEAAKELALANEIKCIEEIGRCPKCGYPTIKKGLFGYSCARCKYRRR